MKAVVVGAGLAGLAVALRLQRQGWKVTVCDNGPAPGGKMNSWRVGPYRFDTGPTLLALPQILRRLLADLGERLEDHLAVEALDPHAEYVFPDGYRLAVPAAWERWVEVVRALEPADVEGLQRLHAVGARIFRLSERTFFLGHPLAPPRLPPLSALRHLPLRHAWGNYACTVERLLRNDRLRRIYLRYPTYVGSSPYLCPATLLVIPYLEHAWGVWKVRGGMYRIVEALAGLARRRGVELLLNTQVTGIEQRDNRVEGVRLASGSRLPADVVVYNGDAAALAALLGETPRVQPAARSLSGVVVLAGLPRKIHGLAHHTIFFSSDYFAEFDELFRLRRFPTDPTVYVNAPDDAALAPPDGQALFIMANAPADPNTSWTPEQVQQATERIFARLERSGIRGIREQAEVFDVWHPGRMAARYLAPGGAIYGDHSHGWRKAFLRPPNRPGRPRGLYCAGGSFHPGGGVPMVLLSAEITARLIQQDWGTS
jgi:phytoene desaturase